ncbi:MAG: hypothetical protein HYS17_06220 [Micavibrio aeruginosavorus]|uniref:Uncharacterized protein n=1 Tax=Micavibrio aeruginosavorus TaxID=349221 RepID=A0A7T5UGP1_9BACT|nr:MAG: hypothetical protein HYS17_06220 [Micavibrio aeruginosavorus]
MSFEIEPDKHQAINGIELAEMLILNAARLIAPYVANCPACIDAVFSAVANQALEYVQENIEGGNDVGYSYVIGLDGDARNAALRSHFSDTRELVEFLLNDGGAHHQH